MNAKMIAPKRGEIGLAKFHRMIGVASFLAGLALMLASFTALYWFGGVIGMPVIARLAVAGAIEVMAASLASSATTARRETGKVDVSAWVGFAFFVSIAAYANIMHVIVSLTSRTAPIAGLPPGFVVTPEFVVAACIFAAACPFGGTFGVHRFGWLRAHGADAEWTDTAEGVVVVEQPKPRTKPEVKGKPGKTTVPAGGEQKPPAEIAPEIPEAPPVQTQVASAAWEDSVRVVFEEMVREDPNTRPTAPVVIARSGVDKHQATVRGFIKTLWAEHEAARPDDEDAPAPRPVSTRDEMHIAAPEPVDDIEEEHAQLQAAHVA